MDVHFLFTEQPNSWLCVEVGYCCLRLPHVWASVLLSGCFPSLEAPRIQKIKWRREWMSLVTMCWHYCTRTNHECESLVSPLKLEPLCLKTIACKAYWYPRPKIQTHQFEWPRSACQLGSCQVGIHWQGGKRVKRCSWHPHGNWEVHCGFPESTVGRSEASSIIHLIVYVLRVCIPSLSKLTLQDFPVNNQAALKRFTKLLEAKHLAQTHASSLDAVKKELDQIELANTMSHQPSDLREHFAATKLIRELHDQSQQKLQDLTTDLGLSDVTLPSNLSESDKEYLKKYTLAQVRQHGILIRLTKYQDEISPVWSSQPRGGHLVAKVGQWHGTHKLYFYLNFL